MTSLHITTNPGLEDVVADELVQRAKGLGVPPPEMVLRPDGRRGRVAVTAAAGGEALWRDLKSAHHVLVPAGRFSLPAASNGSAQVAAIAQLAAELDCPVLERANSFRVTCHREGTHDFQSPEVERATGAALVKRYGLRVSLRDWDVALRVDVCGDEVDVDVQLTRHPLSARAPKVYRAPTGLKANVAYAMVRLAMGLTRTPATVCDPCCGSGTILLEAGALYPQAQLYGGDRFERPARGAQDNLTQADLARRSHVACADARALPATWPAVAFDAIVTNPPFGVRLGPNTPWTSWYREFLGACAQSLAPGGRLAVLVLERGAFNQALRSEAGLRLVHSRIIDMGGLFPALFIFARE